VERAPKVINLELVDRVTFVVLREELRLGLPQLVGEVPEGRWGPFGRYAILLTQAAENIQTAVTLKTIPL
jgi:hypothetical protein